MPEEAALAPLPSAAPAASADANTGTDHTRIKNLFLEVCDLPSRELAQKRLNELGASADDCQRVLKLLKHDDGHTAHLSGPVRLIAASLAGGELKPGDRLGAWTLVKELGQGGMGRVFEAERSDGHYQQRSAIKVLLGFTGESALAQLAHERQVLASLNHPHIAKLLDGGTTPAGNPYLVMEHVNGTRIDEHVRQNALAPDALLQLFLMLCDAVAYAHRRLVVHCDIKPGNVLVDEQGRVKLLDFGIAQLEGRSATDLQAMTPRYASPEQRAGEAATAATDIYSLGRLLETLLAQLNAPSGSAKPGKPGRPGRSGVRGRELHAIVARATTDQAVQRYPDVAALMDDLRRYERNEALVAMAGVRPHWTYWTGKLLRRRWPLVVLGGLLLTASATFTWRLVLERDRALAAEVRALEQQAKARTEAANAREFSNFMVDLFESADTSGPKWSDLRAPDLLARGRERVLKNLTRQPEQQALLLAQLGRLQENIGMFPAASLAYRDAIAMESPDRLNRAEEEADLQFRLAFSEIRMGLLSTAETAARRAVALRRAQVPTQPAGMADALNALGVVLTNRRVQLDEARDLLMQALALRSAASGPEAYQTGQIAGNLAQLELVALRLPEAHAWSKRALEIGEKQAQPVHVPRRLNVLAQILALQGRFDEALETARLGIQKCEVHFGPRNLYCMPIMATQGHILLQAGSPALALSKMDAAIAVANEGGDVKSVLHALRLSRRADVLDTLAKHREADAAHAAALAMARQFGEARDLTRAQVTLAAAEFLASQSRKTEAQALLREVLSVQTGQLSPDHPQQQKALQLAKRVGLPHLGP